MRKNNKKNIEIIHMQLLSFTTKQKKGYPHKEKLGGAFITCWIKNQTEKNAYYIAKGTIEETGYEIKSFELQEKVTKNLYKNDPENLKFYDQALIDNEVFVFDTYPSKNKNS